MLKKSSLPGSIQLGMGVLKYKVRPFRFAKGNLEKLCAIRPALETVRAAPPRTCRDWMTSYEHLLQALSSQHKALRRQLAGKARKLAAAAKSRGTKARAAKAVKPNIAKTDCKPSYRIQWIIRTVLLPGPKGYVVASPNQPPSQCVCVCV